MIKYFKDLFYNTYLSSEQESKDYLREHANRPNLKIIVICMTVAFAVVMVRYFGDAYYMLTFLLGLGLVKLPIIWVDVFVHSDGASLYRMLWWAGTIVVFYFLLPVLIIKLWWKERLSDYGLKFKGAFKDYRLYVFMLMVMVPLVLFFSTTAGFQERYPFYKPAHGEPLFPRFIIWEIAYFFQFLAVEFLFRGFMVHGTKNRFGFYAVFVMMIPYCMVHFGKPFPETIAAIFAGIVLGTLSLKSRSILLGVAIHYSVAITMDICALWYLR
jgi:uncharacterized protein